MVQRFPLLFTTTIKSDQPINQTLYVRMINFVCDDNEISTSHVKKSLFSAYKLMEPNTKFIVWCHTLWCLSITGELTFLLFCIFPPEMIEIVTKLLDKGASINFFMFRGGTNFGFMNGAKHYRNGDYKPVVTSYGKKNLTF